MDDALALFIQVYKQHRDVEICIAELKRKGYSQLDTIKVLMHVPGISVVKADEIVRKSVVWSR